jgi:hypothetical protein
MEISSRSRRAIGRSYAASSGARGHALSRSGSWPMTPGCRSSWRPWSGRSCKGPAGRSHCPQALGRFCKGATLVAQFRGTRVGAQAAGTVAGLGRNFTPAPSTSAEILTENNGTVTIQMTQ